MNSTDLGASLPAFIDTELTKERTYWVQKLSGNLPSSGVPHDFERPAVFVDDKQRLQISVAPETGTKLAKVSGNRPTLAFAVLVAALKICLYKYTGSEEVIVGTAIHEDFGEVASLNKTLALLDELNDALTVKELLRRVKNTLSEAYENQKYPFNKILELLEVPYYPNRAPLFDVVVTLENINNRENVNHLKNDIGLDFSIAADDLSAFVEYNPRLFRRETIGNFGKHCIRVLDQILDSPGARIAEIDLLSTEEKRQLLYDLNNTQREYPLQCVHELFEAQVSRTPEATAVSFGAAELSYEELNRRANQLAHYLRARGVQAESLVAICLERSLEMVVSLLAVLKTGGAYVPLDPAYPEQRLRLMLADAGARVLLTEVELVERLGEAAGEQEVICLEREREAISRESKAEVGSGVEAENLAYVIYTSGSTGRPKGVMISHGALTNHMCWMGERFPLSASDRVLQKTPFSFDAAVWEFYAPLLSGARLVMARPGSHQDSGALVEQLIKERISVLQVVPTLLQMLVAEEELAECRWLRRVYCGGEALPTELVARLQELVAVEVVNLYGPTETTIECGYHQSVAAGAGLGTVPIGRAIANVQMYVLDGEQQVLPVGVRGELYVSGMGLARGYWQGAATTAERFLPHPFIRGGARLYRTGDVGRYLADGSIEFLGRVDEQVKLRGYRIELGELETTLKQHPSVRESAVVIREDQSGNKQLVAYVVCRRKNPPTIDQLREFLKEKLPEHMVHLTFVMLEKMPLNPSGKIDRRMLPDPKVVRAGATQDRVGPRNEIEQIITDIWQDVLKVDDIRVHDNFFDLGGHSLLMFQIQGKLRKAFGTDLSTIDLFKYPNISSLAERLSQEEIKLPSFESEQQRAQKQSDAIDQQQRLSAAAAASTFSNSNEQQAASRGIAVVGMAARLPGAADVDQYWQNLRQGKESITFFTDEELIASGIEPDVLRDPNYVKASGVLDGIDLFDASFFGFTPREAEMTDPQQRLFLQEAWKALEVAGYDPETCPHLIAVYAGVGMNSYLYNLYSNPGLIGLLGRFQTLIGNDKDFLSTRVSYKLNLKGPSVTVQTACSTSLVAIHMACQSLLYHQCDMALAGGVSINTGRAGYFYHEGGILSPDGHTRAFDARAAGMVGGSGVGVVLLKRLEDALADGDHIHAVIRGSATNNDGSLKIGFTAPSVVGQSKVVAAAQAAAGVDARTISYIEAHGTGTTLGDPVEIAALTDAFRASTDAKGFCAIGSVKTNIGHTDAAAGVAGFIKTVLALEHRELPPSLNFEEPNPQIDFANSPFYVNTALTPWTTTRTPRRAGVSSLGLGGTNAHVILEEAPTLEPARKSKPHHLLLLSARTPSALDAATVNLANHLKRQSNRDLSDVAYTLQVGRKRLPHRRTVVAQEIGDAISALETLDPKRTFTSYCEGDEPSVVFMFPGGGSQHIDMALELYRSEPAFQEQVDLCLELLKPQMEYDLRDDLYPGDKNRESAASRMERTSIALPALFAVEYALARLLMHWGIVPQAMIGHSLGEYVAACLAGVLSLEDALALVTLRGRLFEQLPEGAMLSVPLAEEEVRPFLGEQLSIAAINGPALCVVSGTTAQIEELRLLLAARNVESSRLHISVAAHSEMVSAILQPFSEFAETLSHHAPQIPYVSDVTGTWITETQATDPTYWARHLRHTVRFADGVHLLLREKNSLLLEVGPGRTLSTLARQQADRSASRRIFSCLPWPSKPGDSESDAASLFGAVGQLWGAGKEGDWLALYAAERPRRVPLPTYPFETQSYWIAAQKSSSTTAGGQLSLRKKTNIDDWFYLPSWKRSAPLKMPLKIVKPAEPGTQKLSWLLFADEFSLGRRIAERLEEMDQTVMTVTMGERYEQLGPSVFSVRPEAPEDYQRLIESLRDSGQLPQIILHLWSLTSAAPASSTAEVFAGTQKQGYYSLLFLAQALAKQVAENLDLIAITNFLHDVSGAEPACPEKATLLGPCQVISQEHLNISCRCLDVTLPGPGTRQEATLIEQLLAEVLAGLTDAVVAYRGRQRLVQAYEKSPLKDPHDSIRQLRERGVYLITGGLGNVALLLAEYLATTFKARLILVGRAAFPARPEWENWLATHPDEDRTSRVIRKVLRLEEVGSEVIVATADVSDEEQLQSVLKLADERFGEINGVLHAAGVTSGSSILRPVSETGYEESEVQFQAKGYGLYVLEKVLTGRNLDFCLLFSSNASVLGGLGMTAYSAANHFMDAFASSRSSDSLVPWISANWDAWPIDGNVQNRGVRRSIDDYAMTAAESTTAFATIVSQAPPGQIVVSTGDLTARLNLWMRHQFLEGLAEEQNAFHPRPELDTGYLAPEDEIQRSIAEIWQQLFAIDQVGIHDNFFDLGGHSLLATRIVTRLREAFQITLPLRSLLDHPTVAGLALEVSRSLGESQDQDQNLVRVSNPQAEEAQELLARIEQLPEDQVDSLLEKYIS